nr:protein plant cadmium resistance 3 [Quercus suber]
MSNPSASEKNSTIQVQEKSQTIAFQVESRSAPVPWSTGLCDCCEDFPNCCITWLCPCITFGRIAEIVDGGSSCWQGNVKQQTPGVMAVTASMAEGGMSC